MTCLNCSGPIVGDRCEDCLARVEEVVDLRYPLCSMCRRRHPAEKEGEPWHPCE